MFLQGRRFKGHRRWSQQKLADSAGVALATVQFFETDKRDPIANNLAAIRRALEDAGVEFIPAKNGKGVGVRMSEG
jgi:transcriptional regulator with XRE-family HTH domain